MLGGWLISILLVGTFDVSGQLGVAAPFGSLEFNLQGGPTGTLALGYNTGPSRFELAQEIAGLPGRDHPDYALTSLRTTATYHYALRRRIDHAVRLGAGIDWFNLRRRMNALPETGSVLGGTLALTYVRSFGHPQFQFQLYGSELLEFGKTGSNQTLTPATLLGLKLGVGYEF